MEARIRDIEAKLSNAQIIDVTAVNAGGKVVFGATVHLVDAADGSEAPYQIVGEDEADIKSGLLSISSPIARALIGKREGDEVEVVDAERQARLRDHGRRVHLSATARRCHAAPVRASVGVSAKSATSTSSRPTAKAGARGQCSSWSRSRTKNGCSKPGMVCVDLGARPGSWSQLAARIVGSAAESSRVDLLPMDPIPGVDFLQGDFADAGRSRRCASSLGGRASIL